MTRFKEEMGAVKRLDFEVSTHDSSFDYVIQRIVLGWEIHQAGVSDRALLLCDVDEMRNLGQALIDAADKIEENGY